jgi:single-strand DNA-binding protein
VKGLFLTFFFGEDTMNLVMLTGNLTRDPEVRTFDREMTSKDGNPYTKTVTVVNFGIATSRPFKKKDGTKDEETNFFDCEAWDTGAETIAKYFSKGSPILIQGSLKNDSWTDKEGNNRKSTKIRVDRFEFFKTVRKEDKPASETSQVPVGANSGSEDGGSEDFGSEPF